MRPRAMAMQQQLGGGRCHCQLCFCASALVADDQAADEAADQAADQARANCRGCSCWMSL